MRVRIPLLLVVAAVLLALAAVAPAVAGTRADFQTEVLHLINAERAAHGLRAVHLNSALSRAALGHARDMMRRDYFSHTSPDGATCATRAQRAGYGLTGYRCWRISEVLAWGMSSRGTPAEVVDGWLHSSMHRAIILGRDWRDAGVACVEGAFQGYGPSFMYTIDFGRRLH
jgi:uncharacterized protein YkwD